MQQGIFPAVTIVHVRTLSNKNKTGSDDAWPLIEFTPCEKQNYQVSFAT